MKRRTSAQIVAGLVLLGLVVGGFTWLAHRYWPVETGTLLGRNDFRCYTISETARTVGVARIERKQQQVRRIERLLLKTTLEQLDEAKLRSERAILLWDIADARFQVGCAKAYFEPGRTTLRESFPNVPPPMEVNEAREALQAALRNVNPRLSPHGFAERAKLYIAEAALVSGEYRNAIELAEKTLDPKPGGLYEDQLKLVIADAYMELGRTSEAVTLYEEVGRIRIGLDAYYARYRYGTVLQALGRSEQGDPFIRDVLTWAERGDRGALVRFLNNTPPIPPAPKR
ncbi:MAG: hypothetical protein AAFS10_06055 [Myxococcota bacterium]